MHFQNGLYRFIYIDYHFVSVCHTGKVDSVGVVAGDNVVVVVGVGMDTVLYC